MKIFEKMNEHNYEEIIFFQDKENDLRSIVVLHNTHLGPALGGCRIKEYNSEEEALEDVLRLSRGMTFKNAAADLKHGGAKSVIILKPGMKKTPYLIKSFARFVETLKGRYITAQDVGTTIADIKLMRSQTNYVCGDMFPPSPYTAYGVFKGILASAKFLWGNEDLINKVVAIQGVGAVGYELAKILVDHGCKIIVADPNKIMLEKAQKELGAKIVELDEIYDQEVDIFSPCALGSTLNEKTIKRIKAKLIAGSANNQLSHPGISELLSAKNVLYAPDYIINAGGVIAVAAEIENKNEATIKLECDAIYDRLMNLYEFAQLQKIDTHKAADTLTEIHVQKINNIMRRY